ncbi:cytoskeleton protein RodZ [Candidatus Profftia sp. (ex Adelges kitamiensis)]|uniref:cytoskeleton protein RodZ n=1 Tax=Candidatus Profftia sp. (ex Adelges kitamiensis) TaxID=2864218 RepID=UPI001CE2711C|nr:cytoskeleton protein RodZ [Candidatus Profftia sp. (ex Adelges kitamiensis)]
MNTEDYQKQIDKFTIGELLRQGREKLGLTQENISERLCLKISIVRNIEENTNPVDLASTFLRGYIRSYAKIVHISEDEIMPYLEKQVPLKTASILTKQRFLLGKQYKNRESWLMTFTWLVIFVIIGITGSWLWDSQQEQKKDVGIVAHKSSSVELTENNQLKRSKSTHSTDYSQFSSDHHKSVSILPEVSITPSNNNTAYVYISSIMHTANNIFFNNSK